MLQCSLWVEATMPQLSNFNTRCEVTSYGHASERCSAQTVNTGLVRVAAACCTTTIRCDAANGIPSACDEDCARTFELFYAQCREHIATNALDRDGSQLAFLGTCQATADGTGDAAAGDGGQRPPPPPPPAGTTVAHGGKDGPPPPPPGRPPPPPCAAEPCENNGACSEIDAES
jgi:hypothetical protein